MEFTLRRLLKISLFNLLLVASIGVVLRYKILYSLPFVDQKQLLHGHSHFAFAGWIAHTLMVLFVAYLSRYRQRDEFKKYKYVLIINLISAYGMLLSFPVQGYGLVSISFSTLSVFTFYFFTVKIWKDFNKISDDIIPIYWFKAALLFGVISSFGTFGLAYMMANKMAYQNYYLAAVYFYLHFQYNGFFFFSCMGLFHTFLPEDIKANKELIIVFWLFLLAAVPAYFLSTLWMDLPSWVFVIVVLASFLQMIAWIYFLRFLYQKRNLFSQHINVAGKWLMILSATATTVKLFLQLGSTIPSLSQLAFGFRPIVIAYLHLVLLGIITIFLLATIFSENNLPLKKATKFGLSVFVTGVFFNEFVLMLQGVASFSYNNIPFVNEFLLLIACSMFLGILTMVVSQLKRL
jgi:hypothetical protein